ncbi:MAG TPA: amino acid permease [Verrucomicrobiae bacterium]|jgi:APA family basic amino acid/polyamine antiporter|nr:amino acid permease [Verrucomicrobiae bacterium]
MGRWTLTALVINSIIGSGIFGLPSIVAGYLGKRSPIAYLIAGAGIAVIVACFAELASQFGASGGPYLYAREAFGRFVGIEVGWLQWAIKVTAAAAAAILFGDYLVEFWPAAREPLPRLAILTLLVGFLAAVNIRGIKAGATANNIFTLAKLAPLIFFAVAGGVFVLAHHSPAATADAATVAPSYPTRNWFEAVIVLTFPFGGFEGAVVPMAEAKDVRRDAPFALFTGLAVVAAVYCTIQFVVVSVLPDAAASNRPLADAARQMWGPTGASLMSLGALISVYGFLTALMLHTPRLMLALGEKGDFPRVLARIHPRFRTPHVSTLAFAVILWCLAAWGSFQGNVILSSVGRLVVYGFTCAALPVLRRKSPGADSYRLPAGNAIAMLGVLLVALLASQLSLLEVIVVVATVALAVTSWVWPQQRAG